MMVDKKELAMGIEVEKEHTKDVWLAKKIATDHLKEDPKYYTKLKKVHIESTVVVADVSSLAQDQSSLWLMLLGDLKALYDAYQSAHWRSYGDPYYGDHQLYQRLYEDVQGEIDGVAERAIGVTGNDAIVEPSMLMSSAMSSLKALVMPGEFAICMYDAEQKFIQRLATMLDTLRAGGQLSNGVEDLLQGIASKHEEHIYLLSRRAKMQ